MADSNDCRYVIYRSDFVFCAGEGGLNAGTRNTKSDKKLRKQGKIEELKKLYASSTFSLRLAKEKDMETLSFSIPNAKREGEAILFQERDMQAVLKTLAEKQIPIEKLERREADLETFFWR